MPGGVTRPNPWSYLDHANLDPAASLSRLHKLIGALDRLLRLPDSLQSFLVYLGGLFLITMGAMLHVLLAAQIMQAEVRLGEMRAEHTAIEQQNGDLLFVLARESNLLRLHEKVVAAGYQPTQEREYVAMPQPTPADTPDSVTQSAPPDNTAAPQAPTSPPHTDDPLRGWEALFGINLPFSTASSVPSVPAESSGSTGESTGSSGEPGFADPASEEMGATTPDRLSGRNNSAGLGIQSNTSQTSFQTSLGETWQNWQDQGKAFFSRLLP